MRRDGSFNARRFRSFNARRFRRRRFRGARRWSVRRRFSDVLRGSRRRLEETLEPREEIVHLIGAIT